jgi:prevent-host-death family protein
MTRVTVAQARKDFAEIINRAAYARDRTVITRHDSDVAVVVSIDEVRLLDVLIERYEDEQDVLDAREALLEAREDRIPWDAVKSEFGL